MEGGLFLSAFIATPFICAGTRGWDCVEFVLVIVDLGFIFVALLLCLDCVYIPNSVVNNGLIVLLTTSSFSCPFCSLASLPTLRLLLPLYRIRWQRLLS